MNARWFRNAALLLLPVAGLFAQPADLGPSAKLAEELRTASLDPEACYRVRDLQLQRAEASVYLIDGWLAFGRPVGGRRIFAVFMAAEAGDDAEVLLRVPDRGERAALVKAIGAPNLDEHFRQAVFLFTDNTADEWIEQIGAGSMKSSTERGLLMGSRFDGVLRNLTGSFQLRLVLDLLSASPENGIFYGTFAGMLLGNIDVLVDPASYEQVVVGQVQSDGGAPRFAVWASFPTKTPRKSPASVTDDVRLDNYRIDAKLHPDLTLEATTRATLRARSDIRGAVMLEISPQMSISSVTLDGQPAEVFRVESLRANLIRGRVNEPFLLSLPRPMKAGETAEVEFKHSGKVVQDAGNKVYFVATRMFWYPARGLQPSNFDLTFRVPAAMQVVATGEPVEDKVEGEWRVVHRVTKQPVRMAGFNIGDYERLTVTRGAYRIEVCANRLAEPLLQRSAQRVMVVPPPVSIGRTSGIRRTPDVVTLPAPQLNPQARLAILAEDFGSAIEWMAAQFGPLPLTNLVVSPVPGLFGQGFPGLIYLSTVAYLPENERPIPLRTPGQAVFYSDILYAHELAHQWWGNLVAPASYHDDWLHEALANYTALMVLERKKGIREFDAVLVEYRAALLLPKDKEHTIESTGPLTWGPRLRTEGGIDPWRVITYDKGSWVMHMLRRRMGDQGFLKMLGETRRRFESKPITTEGFRQLAAEFLPKGTPDPQLEEFFDSWVYGTGIPTLEMKTSVKGKAPSVTVTVTLTQSGVDENFSTEVPVEIRTPGRGAPLVRWLRTGSEPASFTVTLPAAPSKIELAPGLSVLAIRK